SNSPGRNVSYLLKNGEMFETTLGACDADGNFFVLLNETRELIVCDATTKARKAISLAELCPNGAAFDQIVGGPRGKVCLGRPGALVVYDDRIGKPTALALETKDAKVATLA